MSLDYLNAAFKTNLKPGLKIVLLSLCDQANDDGVCWPSQKTIAQRCSMSDRAVRKHLATLKDMLIIKTEETRRKDGKNGNLIYHLDLFKIQAEKNAGCDDTAGTVVPMDSRNGGSAPITTIPIIEDNKNNNKKDMFGEPILDDPNETHAERFVRIWNSHAQQVPGWPKVQKMTKSRISAMNARIKEWGHDVFWKWTQEIALSDWICTQVENGSARWFKPDWFLNPNNFTKIAEGNYHTKLRKPVDPEAEEKAYWKSIANNSSLFSDWPQTIAGGQPVKHQPHQVPDRFKPLFDQKCWIRYGWKKS